MTNSEIIPFRSVSESQRKSKINDSRLKALCNWNAAQKVRENCHFGAGKTWKSQGNSFPTNPDYFRYIHMVLQNFPCGALFPHDFSKRKSPAARYLLGNLSTPERFVTHIRHQTQGKGWGKMKPVGTHSSHITQHHHTSYIMLHHTTHMTSHITQRTVSSHHTSYNIRHQTSQPTHLLSVFFS